MNEYENCTCPECKGGINEVGFCSDCGFDYEDDLRATEEFWINYAN